VLEEPGEVGALFTQRQRTLKSEMIAFTEPLWSRVWLWGALVSVLGTEWLVRRLANGGAR
jgi:hypothetical protein